MDSEEIDHSDSFGVKSSGQEMAPTGRRKIVIIGGGVIGCCTAYYLSQVRRICFR